MDPKQVLTSFVDALNRHDIDAMLDRLTENVRIADPASPVPLHGKADVRPQYELIFSAAPNIHSEVTHIIAEGNLVFAAVHTTATGSGLFMGRDVTGKSVEVDEALFVRVEGDRIAWGQFYSDTAKLAREFTYEPNPV